MTSGTVRHENDMIALDDLIAENKRLADENAKLKEPWVDDVEDAGRREVKRCMKRFRKTGDTEFLRCAIRTLEGMIDVADSAEANNGR